MARTDLAAAKAALRAEARAARRSLSVVERARAAARSVARLVSLREVLDAGTVALYAALPDEADPFDAVGYLRRAGVRVLLPRVRDHDLEFVDIDEFASLTPGWRGVREPAGEPATLDDIDAIVVPGLAFDRSGRRLGQGGGHYDRLLARLPRRSARIGLCLACQVVAEVPADERDEAVDLLVTEDGVWRTGARDAPPAGPGR